jgi:phosphate:Na+ symporter
MSDGLQKIAGNRLRAVLGGLTRSRLAGIFSGFVLTAAVQSSSATTVLVLSFVNAGLLALPQAIGLVMGANIGTTVTAWLVALLGFKVKISAFALPIIGIGFPLSLIDSPRAKQVSQVMIGFGLLFMGLAFLKDGVPSTDADSVAWLREVAGYGVASIVLFVLAGAAITVVVQSSSASTAVILTMVAERWISFDLAAAMVLGTNIGTTITAQLAAIGANRDAKRVAHFHTLFNVFGVLLILPFMGPLLSAIGTMIPGDAVASKLVATSQVAAFHTVFNVFVTVVLVAFIPQLERMVVWLVPMRDDEKETAHLAFLESGLMGTPELATLEARRANELMLGVCERMFDHLREVIGHPAKKLGNLVDEIKKQEQITDEMEEEIVGFCSRLAQSGTSATVGRDVARYIEIANDIERIADHCMNLVMLAERRWDKKYIFDEWTQNTLSDMMTSVSALLRAARVSLGPENHVSLADARLLEGKINKLRDASRKSHASRMQSGDLGIRQGLIFLDMMTNMEKIGDYCWNVAERLQPEPVLV